jgi:serine/threonine protein kinase
MPPEVLRVGEEEEEEGVMNKPTKAVDIYSYGCIMMQVGCVASFKYHVANTMQVFSGNQPYAHITSAVHVIAALARGREPFSRFTGISEDFQQFAQLCLSRNMQHRPSVGKIVEFLWSQTDTAETMKTMLSQLLDTVKQIPQAVLMKCDYHPDGLDVLGKALKCKWVVPGSDEIEVGVFVSIYRTACNLSVDRSRSRP